MATNTPYKASKLSTRLEITMAKMELATKNKSALQVNKNGRWAYMSADSEPLGYSYDPFRAHGAPVRDIAIKGGYIYFYDCATKDMYRIKTTDATVIIHTPEDRIN